MNNQNIETEDGKLNCNYKFLKREANDIQEYTKMTSISKSSISIELLENIKQRPSETYNEINTCMNYVK